MFIWLSIVVSAGTLQNFPTSSGGAGTKKSPYLIKTPDDLKALSIDVNCGITYEGVYFKVVNDIDFEGEENGKFGNFLSIGGYYNNCCFKGIFNGNGKRLKNISNSYGYSDSDRKIHFAGIFNSIENAEVKNIIIDESCSFNWGALIASAINSTVTGCVNYATHTGSGIVGYSEKSQISDCINYGGISHVSNMSSDIGVGYGNYANPCSGDGGIVGALFFGVVSNCKNFGKISNDAWYVGGIVGRNRGGTVSGCENRGDMEGYFSVAGGIVGECYSFGDSELNEFANSTITGCKNYGNILSHSKGVGGIAGICYGNYDIDGDENIISYPAPVSDCHNYGTIESESYAAGIVSQIYSFVDITGCTNEGTIIGHANAVGGIVAYSSGGNSSIDEWRTIKECQNSGSVTGTELYASSNEFYAGGIVGKTSSPHLIQDCSNCGAVTGETYAGGITGSNSTEMIGCFNSGNVSASSYAGALVSDSYSYGVWKDNYYDSQVVVKVGEAEYGGAISRGAGRTDYAENNGAIMKSVTIEAEPQGKDYWTTFYRKYGNYQADENTTVYTAELVLRYLEDNTSVYRYALTEVPNRVIMEGKGVILKSKESQMTLTQTSEAPTEECYKNDKLRGCDYPEKPSSSNYCVLGTGTEFGFKKFSGDELPANKVYVTSSISSSWPETVELELNGHILYQPVDGDVTGDGVIEADDVVEVANAIILNLEGNAATDINNDGKTDIADIILILNLIWGNK